MRLIYPNKPNEMFPSSLSALDNETSYAEQKVDGWRTFVVKDTSHEFPKLWGGDPYWVRDGDLYFLSRRDKKKGGPVSFEVCDGIVESVKNLDLPDQTMLDSEWLSRRTKDDNIGECLFVFDCLWFEDQWLGDSYSWDRRELVSKFLGSKCNQYLRTPEYVLNNFQDFFDQQKSLSWTEGLVIKDLDATIVGDPNGCQKNAAYIKIKWRGGHDGREVRD